MNWDRQFLQLAAVMSTVTVVAAAVTAGLLYRVAVGSQRLNLQTLASDRAALVTSMARRHEDAGQLMAAVVDAFGDAQGAGETGEVTIAQRVGDRMRWVVPPRFPTAEPVLELPLEGEFAIPMQRAMAGGSGTIVARDYRGERVMAGYAAAPPGWAVVAKMDLAEVRKPFIHVGIVAACLTLALVAFGTSVLLRVSAPVIADLQESTDQLQRVLENMLQGFQIVDSNWRYVYVNPSAAAHGRSTQGELIGKTMPEAYPGIEHTEVFAILQECMSRRVSRRLENPFEYEDGSVGWFELRIEPTPGGLLIQSMDITSQKTAELSIRESEAKLRAFFESSVVGILFGDVHGGISDANDELLRIVGYSREDLVAGRLRWLDITPPEFLESDETGIAEALERGACTPYEKQYVRKDGSRIWVMVGYVLVGETREASVAFVLDISDRKQVEAEFLESSERLRLFIEHAPAALAMFDRDMRYLAVSRRWVEDFGLDDEDFVGRGHYDVFPEIEDELKAIHRRGLAGETMREAEHRFERADGAIQWVSWEMLPWFAADGSVGGIVIATEDITERLRTEHELKRYRDHLEELVDQRTAALSAANSELEAFCYAVSHDLRAPLRSIDGFAQALLEDAAGQLDAIAQRHLDRVRGNAQKMGVLIDELLKLSRLTRAPLHREEVDLAEIATDAAAELRELFSQRDVELVVDEPLVANADPRLMKVVLTNLLGNAWKFTDGTQPARIKIGSIPLEGACAYFVRDNGVGFDMAYAHKLFGAFQRLHSVAEFEGTGIGLATVQRIIHRHGGRVWAEGEVGRGATFYFSLSDVQTARHNDEDAT